MLRIVTLEHIYHCMSLLSLSITALGKRWNRCLSINWLFVDDEAYKIRRERDTIWVCSKLYQCESQRDQAKNISM